MLLYRFGCLGYVGRRLPSRVPSPIPAGRPFLRPLLRDVAGVASLRMFWQRIWTWSLGKPTLSHLADTTERSRCRSERTEIVCLLADVRFSLKEAYHSTYLSVK